MLLREVVIVFFAILLLFNCELFVPNIVIRKNAVVIYLISQDAISHYSPDFATCEIAESVYSLMLLY